MQVQVPVCPNGTTGWIKAEGLQEATTDLRIEVSLSWFRLKMFDGEDFSSTCPWRSAPTRAAHPYRHLLRTTTLIQGYPQPSAYGIAAIGAFGLLRGPRELRRRPAQIAIHGTYDDAAIGTRVSNGCIRMSNADIQSLVDQLPQHLGVPVTIAP